MTRTKSLSLAGEVVRIDQALLISLKSIRSLAEKCRAAPVDAAAKEQLEKYLARPHPMAKRAPPKVKQEKPTESDRRHRKIGRLLAGLSESQIRIVSDLARSMTRESPGKTKQPNPKSLSEKSENHEHTKSQGVDHA